MTIFDQNIRSYSDAAGFLGSKSERPIGHNTRVELRDDGAISVKYHGSPVVVYYPEGSVDGAPVTVLNSCGWRTMTTKERINAFCPAGFDVYQERGNWILSKGYWNDPQRQTWNFADGITIDRFGQVFNAAPTDEGQRIKKLAKSILAYAKAYSAALCAGEVPAPGSGDCWGCCMVDQEGHTALGTDHLISHLDESYYVPSLLLRAIDSKPLCAFSMGALGSLWGKNDRDASQVGDWEKSILTRDVTATITHYLKHELGLAG
jgi:hypothetical protein